jgi:hypothetical protein
MLGALAFCEPDWRWCSLGSAIPSPTGSPPEGTPDSVAVWLHVSPPNDPERHRVGCLYMYLPNLTNPAFSHAPPLPVRDPIAPRIPPKVRWD